MGLVSGERLGPYQILAHLGAGGMGEVYKARDTRLERTVAIKILSPALAADPVFRERFDREARTISALDHPHICALHDIGEQAGLAYLVMQFVEGETLSARLRHGALPLEDVTALAAQIASALEAAHEKGIVHRDLKPGNVVVSPDGSAKVLDFGLAKDVASPGAPPLSMSPTMMPGPTQAGVILGTAAYMAPEQARGIAVDKRADIWAFGCVVYEMLTGRAAFRGETVTDIIAAVVKNEPDWSALPPGTPAKVRHLLRRCLSKDPKRRLRDIGDARIEFEDADLAAPPAALAARSRSRAPIGWIAAAGLTIVTFALGVTATLALRRTTPAPTVTRLELNTPPSSDPGSFALSPDGRSLAFAATREGRTRLWVRELDQTDAQPLPGTDGASHPFWAPDNRAIGFFADARLKRIDRAGGTPQVLADAPFPRGGTWSRDGVIVFSPNTPGGLMRVPADGGPVTAVTKAAFSHRWPVFLPDGRHVLFYASLGSTETNGIYLATLDGGEPRRIGQADAAGTFAPPDRLLVVRQGVLVASRLDPDHGVVTGTPTAVAQGVGIDTNLLRGVFSVSTTGVLAHRGTITARRQFVWMDRSGKTLGTIGLLDENAPASPELAPDGRRLAVQRFVQGNGDLWLLDVVRGVPTRFTFDPSFDQSPVWSPDGRSIVFEATRAGISTLFVKAVSGVGDERALLATEAPKVVTDWSCDGRFVLYEVWTSRTGADLWALPLDGEKPFSILVTPFDEVGGQFSPDGRWVAYTSNASGRNEIYVRPFPGSGEALQVSAGGGSQPRWRRDGQALFYVALDGNLTTVPVTVSRDRQTIEAGTPLALFPIRLATGANIYPGRAQYAVAADGRFLMDVSIDDATAPPISIVLNWDAGLKK